MTRPHSIQQRLTLGPYTLSAFAVCAISLGMGKADAAITSFGTRESFLAQNFSVAASEDFSTSAVDTLIGDTSATQFVSGPFTVSGSSALDAGPFRSKIAGGSHPDNFDGSTFAFLETFGSGHPNQELRNDSATILLSGQYQAFGLNLGSFAEQTSAIFHTNLGNSVSFTGAGPIGSNLFVGVITSTPGEYLTRLDFIITGAATASDGFGVDNLIIGTVPEPLSFTILSIAWGTTLLRRKR